MIDNKVILIGGPPSVGKSTLARSIATRLGSGCISTDDIGVTLRSITTAESHPGLHPRDDVSHSDHYLTNEVDDLVRSAMQWHEELWPAIESLVRAHTVGYSDDPLIIEGWAPWPERVATLEYDGVSSFWLTMSDEDLESRTRATMRFDYSAEYENAVLRKFLARNLEYNRRMLMALESIQRSAITVTPGMAVEDLAEDCIDQLRR